IFSPDNLLKAEVSLTGGQASYLIKRYTDNSWITIIQPSALGIWRSDQDFSNGLTFQSAIPRTLSENYRMLTGKKSELENSFNELEIHFVKGGLAFIITFRVYDEGVAFRYSFPQAPPGQVQVFQEKLPF